MVTFIPATGDAADAWDAAMAGDASVIVFTPGLTYAASRPLVVSRRVIVVAWLATLMFALGGFVVETGGARSVFFGTAPRGTQPSIRAHGYLLRARAFFVLCEAWKFGGDGWCVDGTTTNANCGALIACFSTGHGGRAYSWRGADANAWVGIGISHSNCLGDTEEGPRAAGIDDRSFLGNFFFGVHGGNHRGGLVPPGATKPLAVNLESNSAGGCWAAGYQETSHQVRVMAPSTALGGIYELSPDSTAAQIGGTKNGAGWLGRVAFGRVADDARITFGAPAHLGAVAELSHKGFGYLALRRVDPFWWVVRWRGSKDLLAFREDAPQVYAPHGVWLGTNGNVAQPILVDAARIAAIEARLKALEGQAP